MLRLRPFDRLRATLSANGRPSVLSVRRNAPDVEGLQSKKDGMEAELLQLAREAVATLQLQAAAAGSPSWVEVAQLVVSGGGLLAILGGIGPDEGSRRPARSRN